MRGDFARFDEVFGRTSLVAHEGAAILAVLAIPPIVAALPVI